MMVMVVNGMKMTYLGLFGAPVLGDLNNETLRAVSVFLLRREVSRLGSTPADELK